MDETSLRFSEDHVWVIEMGQSVRIGLSNYAQEQLGEIISATLGEVGKFLEQGVGAMSSEAGVDLRHNRLSRQSPPIRLFSHLVVDLGRDDDFIPSGQIPQGGAELISSLVPSEYEFEVSKKLIPSSTARRKNGRLRSSLSVQGCVPLSGTP